MPENEQDEEVIVEPESWEEMRDRIIKNRHEERLRRDFELLTEEADFVDG